MVLSRNGGKSFPRRKVHLNLYYPEKYNVHTLCKPPRFLGLVANSSVIISLFIHGARRDSTYLIVYIYAPLRTLMTPIVILCEALVIIRKTIRMFSTAIEYVYTSFK